MAIQYLTDRFPAKFAPKIPAKSYFFKFDSTRLHTWVERGTVRVKCLALQEHNTMSLWSAKPELVAGAIDLETSALTTGLMVLMQFILSIATFYGN